MKFIAFYLPQYHPVKENNEWWGHGFTEWTNVAKASPRYNGHYQPHIPADLGFYDLRLPEVRDAQAQLAKEYGIDGFCYYHYWFNGKMLLEKPFDEVIRLRKPDFPFCLCWANENWTRRWDGKDQEILIGQDYELYSPEEHIDWLIKAFSDERYIRINNKPLFLIYRANDIPNLNDVIRRWRNRVKLHGIEDIYIVAANNSQNTLGYQELINLGFDAVNEFEPNLSGVDTLISISDSLESNTHSYQVLVEEKKNKKYPHNFTIFPCVFPSWDNSPRRETNATIIQNENPNVYSEWLMNSMEKVKNYTADQQIVFINAWNEWGEGCHLEPDLQYGKMFLEATKKAKMGDNVNLLSESLKEIKIDTYPNTEDDNKKVLIDPSRPIFIWGTGEYGRKVLKNLLKNEIKVSGFIDSDHNKAGIKVESYLVSNLELVLNKYSYKPFVIVASMYKLEIEDILHNHSFVRDSDYSVDIDFFLYTTVRKRLINRKLFYSIEKSQNVFCNICGFNGFKEVGKETICVKCESTSYERVVYKLLSDEMDLRISNKNTRILLDGVGSSLVKKLKVNYTILKNREQIISSNSVVDYAIVPQESISLKDINKWNNLLDFGGKLFFILNQSIKNIDELTNDGNLFILLRDFPTNNINKQSVVIYVKDKK